MIKSNTEIFGNFAKYLQQDFAPEHWEQMSVQFINHSSSLDFGEKEHIVSVIFTLITEKKYLPIFREKITEK